MGVLTVLYLHGFLVKVILVEIYTHTVPDELTYLLVCRVLSLPRLPSPWPPPALVWRTGREPLLPTQPLGNLKIECMTLPAHAPSCGLNLPTAAAAENLSRNGFSLKRNEMLTARSMAMLNAMKGRTQVASNYYTAVRTPCTHVSRVLHVHNHNQTAIYSGLQNCMHGLDAST